MRIWIHGVSFPLELDYYNNHLGNTILVSPNAETQLIINKISDKKLGLPYNSCYDDLSLFPGNKTVIDYIKSKNETYRQTNCFELCFQVFYMNNNSCNCSKTSIGNVWQDCFTKQENLNQSGCTYINKLNFFKDPIQNKCKDYFPLECETVWYSVNSYSTYRNETRFFVYFESLKFTSISQIPKQKEFDLLSKVGGILGLFIGVRFITVFEIVELMFEADLIISRKKKVYPKLPDKMESHIKYFYIFIYLLLKSS